MTTPPRPTANRLPEVPIGVFLLCLAGIAALFIGMRWLYFLPIDAPKETVESALFAASVADPGKPVSAQLWANRNKTRPDETISVWLNLNNTSSAKIEGLRILDLQSPGFTFKESTHELPSSLGPGASASVLLNLRPVIDHGEYRITVAYGWATQGAGEARDVVSIGPIEVGTEENRRWMAFLRRLASLFKDLTLPIVLAVLGYLFNKLQGARDQKQKEIQEKRGREYQVWASILPRFHELSEQHYLPIVRSLRIVTKGADSKTKRQALLADDKALLEYFYEFLLLIGKMRYLRDQKGQIFFNNRLAERVVSSAWRLFVERVMAEFSTIRIDAALRLIAPNKGTYLDFAERARESPRLIHGMLVPSLRNWIVKEDRASGTGDFGAFIGLLNVMKEVFYFEANRPFDKYWYQTRPDFDLDVTILSSLPEESQKDLKADLTKYIEETKKYVTT